MFRVLRHLKPRPAFGPEQPYGPATWRIERLLEQAKDLDIGTLIRLSRAYAELEKAQADGRPGPIAEAGALAMELARPAHRTKLAATLRARTRRLVWDTWWVDDGPNVALEQVEREAAINAIDYALWTLLLEDLLPATLAVQLREPWRIVVGADSEGADQAGQSPQGRLD
jgi:hypothetical protein